MSRNQRGKTAQGPWLSAPQLRAWRAFMSVQMRMNYEMNRQLQSDSDLSLADYHVLNALTDAPGGRMQSRPGGTDRLGTQPRVASAAPVM